MSFITIFAAAFSIYVYVSSRVEKAPCYAVESANLVSAPRASKEIEVLFAGKPVEQVTSANVWFWNAGSRTIEASDIARADPLRIVLPGDARILSAKILKYQRNTMLPNLKSQGREVLLSFDFMDRGDGCLLQVLHTRIDTSTDESAPVGSCS